MNLFTMLSVELSINSHLLATMMDGACYNSVAMWTPSIVYSTILNVRCSSHTLDILGNNLNTPTYS